LFHGRFGRHGEGATDGGYLADVDRVIAACAATRDRVVPAVENGTASAGYLRDPNHVGLN
jgi:hypothetical protein